MKNYNVTTSGDVPADILKAFSSFDGKPANKENFIVLSDDIDFYVCDIKACHGNTNNDKTAWLSPKNGDNTWSLNITIS